jgi:hypothetical protein
MTASTDFKPTLRQFSLRTAFFGMTLTAVVFAVAAPYLRRLHAGDIRYYGLLALNFAVPAIGGVLGAQHSIRKKTKRAGAALLSIPATVKARSALRGWLFFGMCFFTGSALLHAMRLDWLRTNGSSWMDPVIWPMILMHLNIGAASFFAAMLLTWWQRSRREEPCLNLHEHGIIIAGIWFSPWKRITGYRWSKAYPLQLSVWMPTYRLTAEVDETYRKQIEAIFETHGIWGRTKLR